ncbi:unnamed protein product [Rotaria sp. Silwood2]|nr:unnamed protein product [Rotaria sp. Silwood2]
MVVDILCDTKSNRSCPDDSDALQVRIGTGDVLYAGTDSQVSVVLRIENGVICQVLDLNNSSNDRERHIFDEYEICCSKEFNQDDGLTIAAFAQLPKGNFVPFISDDWFIEPIEVHKNKKTSLRILFSYLDIIFK